MTTLVYVALASAESGGGYRAFLPDLEGCEVQGADLAELLMRARSALTARLEALESAGEVWPAPTPIEKIAAPVGTIPVPIDVAVDDPPIRVNVSLGERLVQRLDAAAERAGMTRSGFIAQAVRTSLGESSRGPGDFDAMGRRLQAELSALGRRINDSLGPDSTFSRRMMDFDDVVYDGVRKAADSVSAAVSRRKEAARRPSDHRGDAL
jgi:predicted RNase H-like HicB family nuclease